MQQSTEKIMSPFHAGEKYFQEKAGKNTLMEHVGRRVIRSFMPEQHRQFYQQLPFVVAGSVDQNGDTWASILPGEAGFIQSPTPTSLTIDARAALADPIHSSLQTHKAPIGLLGIDLSNRRRNRVNLRVKEFGPDGTTLNVDQSFGNCPQYIQTRALNYYRPAHQRDPKNRYAESDSLDERAELLIEQADTFFVSSYVVPNNAPHIEGVDVSHRGGLPGFVKLNGNVLTIPEYTGNFHFNTLGNFLVNPKAGLVFPDFASGDVLMLTGSVEILSDDAPELEGFVGAERGWRFTLKKALWLFKSLPFTATFDAFSANSKMTGTWHQAEQVKSANAQRNAWQPLRIVYIEKESSDISSFYFEHSTGQTLVPFEAGQYLTLKLAKEADKTPIFRTYSLSSAPNEKYYRISVKREANGEGSIFLHDKAKVGDIIEVKYPSGNFYFDAKTQRPAVLIAAGVGITPMISMAKHAMNEGLRHRRSQEVTVIHVAKTRGQRAFYGEFTSLASAHRDLLRYKTFLTQPESGKHRKRSEGSGRIDAGVFKQILGLDDYDFYVCGPSGFMQSTYDQLRSLGVKDSRIHAESFGPANVTRKPESPNRKTTQITVPVQCEAKNAIVKFAKSNFEQPWSKIDGTLLELAEKYGLSPEYGCRNGRCGSCAAKIIEGKVTYSKVPTTAVDAEHVLLCCAVPALGSETLAIEL